MTGDEAAMRNRMRRNGRIWGRWLIEALRGSAARDGAERTIGVSVVRLGPYDENGRFVGDPEQTSWGPEIVEVPERALMDAVEGLRAQQRKVRTAVLKAAFGPLLVFVGCVAGLAASAGSDGLSATVTVVAPSRALPEGMAERELRIEQLEPLEFRKMAGLVADLVGVEAVLEERPGRVAGGTVVHKQPVPFGLAMTGKVPAILDELARLSGYDWSWAEGRLVFFRYGDSEQREAQRLPSGVAVDVLAAVAEKEAESGAAGVEGAAERGETAHAEMAAEGRLASGVPGQVAGGPGGIADPGAVAAVEGQGEASAAVAVPQEPAGWEVEPARHETVEGVLRAWAERAGWNLAWETERQFEVRAAAVFEGRETEEEGFLAAADELLAIAPMRGVLSATAFPNRWLVVRDVGGAVQ